MLNTLKKIGKKIMPVKFTGKFGKLNHEMDFNGHLMVVLLW